MNINEFNKIKDLSYTEYCDYLNKKYGQVRDDYFTKNFSPKPKCKRTKDGLFVHHIMEDRAPLLSNPADAMLWPFEYQEKQNLVYCDYLEHMWLHVLICKYPKSELVLDHHGLDLFLIPGLDSLYKGQKPKYAWEKPIYEKVIHDKDVFEAILKVYIEECLISDNFL